MATALLRPDATAANTLQINTAATAHEALDDVVTQPTAPSTAADYVFDNVTGDSAEVHVPTQVVGSVSAAKAWAYVGSGALAHGGTVKLFKGASEIATVSHAAGAGNAWVSANYTGALTQAEVDDLRIKVTVGTGGAGNSFFCYAAYVELTYTEKRGRMLMGVG